MEYFRLILVEKGSINKIKHLKLSKPLIFRTKIHFENVQSLRVSIFQPLPYRRSVYINVKMKMNMKLKKKIILQKMF